MLLLLLLHCTSTQTAPTPMVLKILIIKSSAVSPVCVQLKQQSDTSRLIFRKSRQQKITNWLQTTVGGGLKSNQKWISTDTSSLTSDFKVSFVSRHSTTRSTAPSPESGGDFRTTEPTEEDTENSYRTATT